jgi:hypothetical protein
MATTASPPMSSVLKEVENQDRDAMPECVEPKESLCNDLYEKPHR